MLPYRIADALDAFRLRRAYPKLAPTEWDPPTSPLASAHREYVEQVSTPGMAVSLETSVYLDMACRVAQASRVLDTGSGFSSYVVRRYASETGAKVVSVDDNPEWLTKTEAFLSARELATDDLITWGEFLDRTWEPFDVVFHDLAMGQLREDGMPIVGRLLRPGGCVIYDDAHHAGHRKQMLRVSGSLRLRAFSLRRWTFDSIQRYALIAAA